MSRFFIGLYHFFRRHVAVFYLTLAACVLFMAFFASRVRIEESVANFFPDTYDTHTAVRVFGSLKVKDKIVLMLSAADSLHPSGRDSLAQAADELADTLQSRDGGALIKQLMVRVDARSMQQASRFVYDYLPLFLEAGDYQRLDSLLMPGAIARLMQKNYAHLLSPAGFVMQDYILKDPLGMAGGVLKHLQDFRVDGSYRVDGEHIFSPDGSTLLLLLTPRFDTGHTGENDRLVRLVEHALAQLEARHPSLKACYFGGPSVAVYNARQVKQDTMVTSVLAVVVIIAFMLLVFKNKRTLLLLFLPVAFGVLFALCVIYFVKGDITAVAVGAGSAVLGIALSYSIHMLAHQNHVSSVEQLLADLAYPLTVGSFTTIGAFLGLLFASSGLLRDFGLFASLSLIGTTLFCLVFLPHFLSGQEHIRQGRVLTFIERINAYRYDKNKWLVGGICLLTAVCVFTSQRVTFNDDMMSINYEPPHLKQAERQLTRLFGSDKQTVMFVSTGRTMEEALAQYDTTHRLLDSLKRAGDILSYASAERFLVSPAEQSARLQRWQRFWTPSRRREVAQEIRRSAAAYGFREDAFAPFFAQLDRTDLRRLDYATPDSSLALLDDWQATADSLTMLITQVRLDEAQKSKVYPVFGQHPRTVVFDRHYFANKWVSAVNQDFYLILYLSSCLIFLALWISYGRIELTLMSFLPMVVSWIIIIGIMGMAGMEFNIVNIILSTFIFGLGDDFSIFIMEGLLGKYRCGRRLLDSHKTAIFFSAFTTVVGMGALVAARHPALQSLSWLSIVGMVAVVLVAFTFLPILFDFFIARPASKGLPPYTLMGILRTALLFLVFAMGCVWLRLLIGLLYVIPVARARKQQWVERLMHVCCRRLLRFACFVKKEGINPQRETFGRPAIIIANHQSFIDILVLLATVPKVVMVTNDWVWRSPVFGAVIRYAGFLCIRDGYEACSERIRRKMSEGYSVVIFPEGTRTRDGRIKRFHKGAFYIAEQLQADLLPVLLYGHRQIISKAQPFYVRKGLMAYKVLPRIAPSDGRFGNGYRERTKQVEAYMRDEYRRFCEEKNTAGNPAFYESLVLNYIYKGPVVEWYIRVKVKMEHCYALFDRLLPRRGQITDVGCGMGPLDYMLSMYSEERRITGIDYDADKIALASHGWLMNDRLRFVCADALTCELPQSDAFVLNDMLHYLPYECQQQLLARCAARLRQGGLIVLRDGNASAAKHRTTRLTELLSTRFFRFNKTAGELHFTSAEQIRQMATACGMQVETHPNDGYTSNTIYILRKQDEV